MSQLLEAHLTHLRVAGYSQNTIHDRRRLLSVMDGSLPQGIDHAMPAELTAFLDHDEWSQWTRVTYFRHITGFYRWASAGSKPYLDYDPSAELKSPKNPDCVPYPVEDEEVTAALARANSRWKVILMLAGYAGLRAGEITLQRREDITEKRVRIVQGKGGKDAYVPTHPALWECIKDHSEGLLVPSPRRPGEPLAKNSLTNSARRLFDSWGMYDVYLHRWRHWFGTKLVEEGNDMRVVQELMRHRSILTTAGYVRVVDEQRRLAICTLPVPSNSPLKSAA